MPPARRCKAPKPDEKLNSLRKSPRKKSTPQAIEKNESPKTPKRTTRKSAKLVETLSETPSFDFSDCTPSTSKGSEKEKTCAFYRVRTGEDGKPQFSKSLIKYFMTVDSPEMEDLKNKRFNTSFLREHPKNRDSLKVFTEEEDNDEKWLENVPKLNFHMPEIPGSEHATIFESMPINVDSDEEVKSQAGVSKRRKSTRCTEFKGKPLPEQSLSVDYTAVLDSESSYGDADDDTDELKETEMRVREKEKLLQDALSNDKNSILLTLLSSPSGGPITPYQYNNVHPSYTYNSLGTKEDKKLLSKYKDIMGDKQVYVVLPRLPIDVQLYGKRKLNVNSKTDVQGRKKLYKVKETVDKKVKVPRLGLSKLQKKKRCITKP